MTQLDLDVLSDLVERLDNQKDPNRHEVATMLALLREQMPNACFNIMVHDAKLDQGLASVLLRHATLLSIQEKLCIVEMLNHLSYYNEGSAARLAGWDEFVDYLRREMGGLLL